MCFFYSFVVLRKIYVAKQWCRRRGCRDASATPKVLIYQNTGKIPEQPVKIIKIWEKSLKIRENGAQRCLTSKMMPKVSR